MEIMIASIFHIGVVLLNSCFNMCHHPTPSLNFHLHASNGADEGSQIASFNHFLCMCGHCMGCSQCFKIECPRLAKFDEKLITPKGVSTP
jgi:hypothetical protein